MLRVLEERAVPHSSLRLLASARSAGAEIPFAGKNIRVEELTETSFEGVDVALFSAGGSASKRFAPAAVQHGCTVIDNSSAWRMHPHVPLVVPEVNPHTLDNHNGIIANPNCSTIQLVVVLRAIEKIAGLRRVVCDTYQSISGAGQKGVDQLMAELDGSAETSPFAHPIAFNTMFHSFAPHSHSSEEEAKMENETKKILEHHTLRSAFTCVRIPSVGGHGEAVTIETESTVDAHTVRETLKNTPGVIVVDDPENNVYPTPKEAHNRDEVFVGRIRPTSVFDTGIQLWIVSDNIRKGAATNAVQILQSLVERNALHVKERNFNW